MIYTLKRPIKLGTGDPITELNFREEVCAGDLRGISLADLATLKADDVLKIAGRLSGRSEPEMLKLSIPDLMKATEIIGGFLSAGL